MMYRDTDIYKSQILNDFFCVKDKIAYNKTEKNMLLAANIEKAIKNRGLNKKQFALAIRVQPSVVSKWLSGTHNFTIDTLYEIERVLSISIINYT